LPQGGIAPAGRFQGARIGLGRFAGTGSRSDLESGLGRYVRGGMGGAARGAARMGGTATTAGALYNVLSSLSTGTALPPDLSINPAALAGRSSREVMDTIVEAIRPIDGTLDSEASREALDQARSDLLAADPYADLTALTANHIDLMVERYVAYDLCHRIELDVGNSIEKHAPNAVTAVARLEEMKSYVMTKVQATFETRRQSGQRLNRANASGIVAAIIRDTLQIFEDYLQ
jgi:hypothetical protein